MRTLLLVDDDDDVRAITRLVLGECGYAVVTARSAEEALELFDPQAHALVVTDNSMPGMSGTEMARKIKERSPATPIVMYTGSAPANQSNLDAVIQKPVPTLALCEAVDRLLADPT